MSRSEKSTNSFLRYGEIAPESEVRFRNSIAFHRVVVRKDVKGMHLEGATGLENDTRKLLCIGTGLSL